MCMWLGSEADIALPLLLRCLLVSLVRCCTSQSLRAWPGSSCFVIALAGLLVLGFQQATVSRLPVLQYD